MSRWKPAGFGGGSLVIPNETRNINVPQHDLDVEICRLAFTRLDAGRRRAFAAKEPRDRAARISRMRNIAKDCMRDLERNPFSTLSPGQRKMLLKSLRPDDAERLGHPGEPTVPEVLKHLPKKPPTRRSE